MPILHWVNDEDVRRAASSIPLRLLKRKSSYGDPEQAKSNILVHGDNLLALKALLPFYKGKVGCIYIDPPYNTGNALEHYDDKLEHSQWLSILYPRLVLLREFLSEDGLFWIQLDDKEVHYAKCLLDEIFGRENFVSHITYERSAVAGLGQGGFFVDITEHILLYKKNRLVDRNVRAEVPFDIKKLKRYSKYVVDFGSRQLVKEFYAKSNGEKVSVYKHSGFKFDSISLKDSVSRESEILSDFSKHLDVAFRGNRVQKENEFQNDIIEALDKNHLYSVDYIPSRGKNKGQKTTLYYYNKELLSWLKDLVGNDSGELLNSRKLTTLWTHEEIPKADIAHEGGVYFPRSKKPEQLIRRIIQISTDPQDIVMDSFLGSGTTAAVAHKMGRHYIGIEMGDHATTHCIPRLERVISGEQSGISKAVNWQGGGGFSFYELSDPVFDKYGGINPKVDFETLSAYVWQCETGCACTPEKKPFLGVKDGVGVYFLYNGVLGAKRPESGNVLTPELLEELLGQYPHEGPKVIYAEAMIGLDELELREKKIVFKQIPYDIRG